MKITAQRPWLEMGKPSGTYTMQFDHYEELPDSVKEALMRGRGYAF